MELYLPLLIYLHMIPIQVARGQNSISSSIVCLNATTNTPCGLHSLTCPANTSIFILEAKNGFVFSPSSQSGCAGGVCDQQCCSRDNFQCFNAIKNSNFVSYFKSCWGNPSCTTIAAFDTRAFTEENQSCDGTAALAAVSYQCLSNLPVVRFDDKRNVSGTAVVAKYLNNETDTSSCLGSKNSLKCDVTLVGAGSTRDVRVMLVIEHDTLVSKCSMLTVAEHGISTGNRSCGQNLVIYAAENIAFPDSSANLSIEMTLQEGNHPIKAWAVVTSNTTSLEMQCGRGTCKPSTVTSPTAASSTSTSATTNSSQTPTASPLTTTTENSSTTSSSSSQAGDPMDASTSPGSSTATDNSSSMTNSTSSTVMSSSSTGTTLSSTDSSTTSSHSDTSTTATLASTQAGEPSNVAAIVGGVVGSAIAIVLVIAIIVVCYRRRSSAKKFHSSDDGEVNPVALDDTKREQLDGERPPSDYEDVDDPVPGRRKVSYSSILLEADETPAPSTPPPDDSESDYDHLRQRRPTSSPLSDVTYGRLGEVDADDDPDYDYDRLGCSIKRGTPDPEASQEDPYSRLHVMGKTPDVEPGDDAGIADDVTGDVNADDVNIKESNARETKL